MNDDGGMSRSVEQQLRVSLGVPADADKVLLRWKLDSGNYRVIFGDLKIEDVTPAKLKELEAK